jgi:murein DD-endopeptidase MepM/ murein hydrolase activator NlpD
VSCGPLRVAGCGPRAFARSPPLESLLGDLVGKNMKKIKVITALMKFDSRISKRVRKLNRDLDKAGRIELEKLASKAFARIHFQLKIRPRLRLLLKIMPILVLTFVLTNKALAYVEPKKGEIKVNGQAILVAEGNIDNVSLDEVEISQSVEPKLSPFEFVMPVESGQVSQGYTSYHRAYDFATSFGSFIKPVGSGVVEFAGFTSDGKGNIVIIDHGDGLKTLYAHMGKIYVGVGNIVDTNTPLGTIGLTGRTTGPHVHFELYDNELAVNPGNLLPL